MPPTAAKTKPNNAASGNEKSAQAKQKAQTGAQASGLLSVEGIMMLIVAIIFDMAGLLCAFLIWVFGIGAVLGRFVSGAGLILFTIWAAIRGGESPGKQGRDQAQAMAKKTLKKFFKKHWKCNFWSVNYLSYSEACKYLDIILIKILQHTNIIIIQF